MKTGKQEIFSALFRRYYAPLCLYARQFVEDTAACEDIVSDVFSNLWSKSGEFFLDEAKSVPYLKSCVRNACLNHRRHEDVKLGYHREVTVAAPSYADSADSLYTLEELSDLLNRAVARMSESQRQIFKETWLEGKKEAEVAQDLGVSVRTVERQRSLVRKYLQDELKDYIPLLLFLSLLFNY